jgi:hypothetical protein
MLIFMLISRHHSQMMLLLMLISPTIKQLMLIRCERKLKSDFSKQTLDQGVVCPVGLFAPAKDKQGIILLDLSVINCVKIQTPPITL